MEKIYYFAYGSNLDESQMKDRCPNSRLVGKFCLKDYKLDFTIFSPKRVCGCADIIKNPGTEVWGLVYELTKEDLDRLDVFEANPDKYKRFTTKVVNDTGEELPVETYEVVEKSFETIKPSKQYHGILVEAGKKYNFPDLYQKYIQSFETL